MASTTVRVSERTHQVLRELAAAKGEPLQQVLEEAVERYRRVQFFADLRDAYARLAAQPAAWNDELAERAELESTLEDGLDDL
jgi:predicted transcriptional regulator